MDNIYVLNGKANSSFEADHADVILTEANFVLVECSLDQASTLAREWGLEAPLFAKDGVWVSESGDELYIANGAIANSVVEVANTLGYNVANETGFSPADYGIDTEDFLRLKNRIF